MTNKFHLYPEFGTEKIKLTVYCGNSSLIRRSISVQDGKLEFKFVTGIEPVSRSS